MTEDSPSLTTRGSVSPWQEVALRAAIWVGLLAAVIALIVGLSMALKSKVAPCENGHSFPNGTTDFNCYVHPQAGTGVAIALFSIILGILIVFCGLTAEASWRARTATVSTPTHSD